VEIIKWNRGGQGGDSAKKKHRKKKRRGNEIVASKEGPHAGLPTTQKGKRYQ